MTSFACDCPMVSHCPSSGRGCRLGAFPGYSSARWGVPSTRSSRERYQAGPHRAVERIEAVRASAEEGAALDVDVGAPLLCVDRVAYDKDDRVVEVGHELFRGDHTHVVVWVEEADRRISREDHIPVIGTQKDALPNRETHTAL